MNSFVNGGYTDQRFVFRDGAIRDVEAFSVANGKTTITDTGTVATVGSIVRFENGTYQYAEYVVVEVPTANSFVIPGDLSSLVVGDDFYILKFARQRVDDTGAQTVVATSGPLQFVLDAGDTEVEKDTTTPANNKPLPVQLEPARAGSFAEILNLAAVAQTFTAPARAVGFKIQALSSNTENIRMKVGAAATASSGFRLEPGRSEDFDLVGTISVIAEAGTNQEVCVQWLLEV